MDWIVQIGEGLTRALERLSIYDHALLLLSLLVFALAKTIIVRFNSKTKKTKQERQLRVLRFFSVVCIGFYVAGLFVDERFSSHLTLISETGITILVGYLSVHFFGVWCLSTFGKVKGEGKQHTYASEIVALTGSAVIAIIGLVIVLQIWGLESLLETTSVLGVIALLVFTTKDFWLGEAIACLKLLYHNKISTGTIIRLKDQGNFTGVIDEINLTQTTVKHLVRKNETITLPNSFFLRERVDIIRAGDTDGGTIFAYVDFKIGYGTASGDIAQYFDAILLAGEEKFSSIKRAKNEMVLVENGDHAARWRLNYLLVDTYELISVENYLNRVAYDLQGEFRIDISTPLTHAVALQGTSRSSSSGASTLAVAD